MPRSILLGRQRRSVTVYHYDDDGRLEWSESLTDGEWLDEDRDAALARKADKDGLCSGCRQPLDDSTDPAMKNAWTVESVDCFACQAVARGSKGQKPGQRFRVVNRLEQ